MPRPWRSTARIRFVQLALSPQSRPVIAPHDRSRPMPEPRGASHAAFLTLPRAAEYLGISPNTLYVWRHRRQGPPSFRMGRRVMCRITALDEWVCDQERADSCSNRALDPLNQKPQRRSRAVK
ncbi:helix-turn-helix domain-containing protein [Streptomyces rubradiris]|uniref:helix-turn-helix domain-containing protein n=1 Tax=Streptomyces rubradiris TaxID=285531 RepID=UPI0036EADEEB